MRQVILPALSEGRTVVCDRYVDSSIAYQGYGRGMGDSVAAINSYAIEGCMPDLTILLNVDPAAGRKRIGSDGRLLDRLEEEELSFHERVHEGYMALAERFPERIAVIDGALSIDEVSEQIAAKLAKVLLTHHDI